MHSFHSFYHLKVKKAENLMISHFPWEKKKKGGLSFPGLSFPGLRS